MTRIYIYGTPHGFNAYPAEVSGALAEYFKAFYISSRRGSRLMVNRLPGGLTRYNYLRYGIIDEQGRINAFFGMTLETDDGQYTPDFKEVLAWGDYLFDQLVKRGHLFTTTDQGVPKYRVQWFNVAQAECDWLRTTLPKILAPSAGTTLAPYDDTFATDHPTEIACFNPQMPDDRILRAWHQCGWLALSSTFKMQEVIEIDLEQEAANLLRANENLVPLALNATAAELPQVNALRQSVAKTTELLGKYAATTDEPQERTNAQALQSKYQTLLGNIDALISKIAANRTDRTDATGKPSVSGRLDVSDVSDMSDVSDSHITEPTRKCDVCGNTLPLAAFNGPATICRSCTNKGIKPPKPGPGTDNHDGAPLTFFIGPYRFGLRTLLIAAGVIVTLVIALCFIIPALSHHDDQEDKGKHQPLEQLKTASTVTSKTPVREEFDWTAYHQHLVNGNFIAANQMLNPVKDPKTWTRAIPMHVQWEMIHSTDPVTKVEDYLTDPQMARYLQPADTWREHARVVAFIQAILELPGMSEDNYNSALDKLLTLPNELRAYYNSRLNDAYAEAQLQAEKTRLQASEAKNKRPSKKASNAPSAPKTAKK